MFLPKSFRHSAQENVNKSANTTDLNGSSAVESFQIICSPFYCLQTISDDEESRSQYENGTTDEDEGYLADNEESDDDVTPAQAVSTCCVFAREVLNIIINLNSLLRVN